MDLDERAEALAEPLNVVLSYVADRGTRPLRAPWWLPTPARHRARSARAILRQLAADVLAACRTEPQPRRPAGTCVDRAATDPETGRALSDLDICNDLIAFMFAGHDTTATTLAYALWALGWFPKASKRSPRQEVTDIGDHALTHDDVPRLGYTVQVLREALRLCPPVVVAGRTAMRDIEVDSHRSRGSMVLVGIFGMQRDPALWDNPLDFDPERFNPENISRPGPVAMHPLRRRATDLHR